jgi:hypothetical protein
MPPISAQATLVTRRTRTPMHELPAHAFGRRPCVLSGCGAALPRR